ncbi:MAG: hypothetical protein IJ043_06085 [Clostridia bacterium]|nr:hypothetical protein [Clostridia bacterium]
MFKKAIPVWVEQGLNTHLVFSAETTLDAPGLLRLAAADFYKLYINGEMVGFGPARTAEGYARVDEYPLAEGKNIITAEVAGYRCRSLSTCFQNSFFIAEVEAEDQVLLYTGRDFDCYRNDRRVQKVERYSVQRHFGEIYHLSPETLPPAKAEQAEVDLQFIPRRVPFADLSVTEWSEYAMRGVFRPAENPTGRKNAYSFAVDREPEWGYFPEEEIQEFPFRWVGAQELAKTAGGGSLPAVIGAGEWMMLDLGRVEVGFLRMTARASADSEVILAFCELCPEDIFQLSTMNAQTVVQYNIKSGMEAALETFEPYSFRKAAVFVKKGSITLKQFGFRNFARDLTDLIPRSFKDPELQSIYEGAVRTFAHNAVDLFTDCPSRERAGWLCDSYFTGRAEYFLFGKCPIEEAFLENFVLYKNRGEFPEGVLPMAYPGDGHGVQKYGAFKFIPQWDMWYILEVCEYLTQRNPTADPETFRRSVMGILHFLEQYENELGLLEKLPSWNFVEWSKANDWTWDVNYPTNFLYAQVLEETGKLYGLPENLRKAEALRKTAIEMAFNGEVFVDNALRTEQGLENTRNVSEAGQYYAALFGKIDLNSPKYAQFKTNIYDSMADFQKKNEHFEHCPADAFIGLYLRMNVLLNLEDPKLMAENLKGFFGGMCALTGTLWEYKTPTRSLDHGFASFAALTLPLADQ